MTSYVINFLKKSLYSFKVVVRAMTPIKPQKICNDICKTAKKVFATIHYFVCIELATLLN